jgi:uncharacterized membrane protein YjjP (DUF1212 family)
MPDQNNRSRKPPETTTVLTFMAEYGRAYLSSGGPTSRLEESLASLGRKIGYPAEVFATPTGIFVSCVDTEGHTHTTLSRIKDNSINLGRLCWLEGIFEDVFSGKISLAQANRILHSKITIRPPYTFKQTVLAALVSGFVLSYQSHQRIYPAIASGVIATTTWWLAGPGLKTRITSSIFRDFIGCVVTLGLSALFQVFSPAPFDAYSIGGLVILVPGLALTTAISELADQNLVSGTAKLMQAILTLLAIGLAFMLFQSLSESMGLHQTNLATVPNQLATGYAAIGAALSVSCFGILFRVPKKSLFWSACTGMLGWTVLRLFTTTHYIVAASFLASLSVGVLSLWFGHRFKVPSQVYSVPGIIAMLPGMLAFTSFRSIAMGQESSGIELGMRVALTAGSIVFGLFTARIPFALRFTPRVQREL